MTSASPVELSTADARRLLTSWHLAPTDVAGVFARHGSVQYDPLRPMGTNADLVLQARVPGYRVDAWQDHAYGARAAFDGWDKQASLVDMSAWPRRRIYHRWHDAWWRERVLDPHADVVDAVVAELEARGPLASADFEDGRRRDALQGSWYGPRLTKHALRALWHTGRVATHHRRNGQHVYDLVERVVPRSLRDAPEPPDDEQVRFLVEQRHRSVGLLRPNASRDIWSMPIATPERTRVIDDLAAEGVLVPCVVDGVRYHAHRDALATLEAASDAACGATRPDVVFLAPLDPLLWDRVAVERIFGFEYVWEVYKPERERRWGYYVLPVLYRGRMVARFDGRSSEGLFELRRFWLEAGFEPTAEFWEELEGAFQRFLAYLGAAGARANRSHHAVCRPARDALKAAAAAGPLPAQRTLGEVQE